MTTEGVQRVAAPKMWEVMAAVENPEPLAVVATPAPVVLVASAEGRIIGA